MAPMREPLVPPCHHFVAIHTRRTVKTSPTAPRFPRNREVLWATRMKCAIRQGMELGKFWINSGLRIGARELQSKHAVQARESGGQSKWGRHCCRPHSYRRVVAPKSELGARFFASPPRGWEDFKTGARTGIRYRLHAFDPKAAMQGPQYRDRYPHSTVIVRIAWPKPPDASSRRPENRPVSERHTATISGDRLASGQGLPHTVLDCRSGLPATSGKLKFPFDLRLLEPSISGGFLPSRRFETAPRLLLFQVAQERLIHLSPILRWTEVDNSTGRRTAVRSTTVALRQQLQPQRVEANEPFGIMLIVRACIVFERYMSLGIERLGRAPADDAGQPLV